MATASFDSLVKVGEDVLRPAGLTITGAISSQGILLLAPTGSDSAVVTPIRCKLVLLERLEDDSFKGSILDSAGNPMLSPATTEADTVGTVDTDEAGMYPFDYCLCVHMVQGRAGGLKGVKSLGHFPPSTGILIVPTRACIKNGATTHITLPKWYFIAAEARKGECAVCGTYPNPNPHPHPHPHPNPNPYPYPNPILTLPTRYALRAGLRRPPFRVQNVLHAQILQCHMPGR